MAEIKKLLDEFGIIYEGNKVLPQDLKSQFIETLAELEDNECHKTRTFPKTRLHKVAESSKQFTELTLIKFLVGEFMYNMTSLQVFDS